MVFGSSLAGALVALAGGRLGWPGSAAGVSWRAGVAWYGGFCGRARVGRVRARGFRRGFLASGVNRQAVRRVCWGKGFGHRRDRLAAGGGQRPGGR
jgi:hypothetical protein